MTRPISILPGYCNEPFVDPTAMLATARSKLRRVDFDTMVGTGLSGMAAVPILAKSMRKNMLLIRKEKSSHDSRLAAGLLGERWIFVDDLVASGTTFRTVHQQMREVWDQRRGRRSDDTQQPVYVGRYTYAEREWIPASEDPLYARYCAGENALRVVRDEVEAAAAAKARAA